MIQRKPLTGVLMGTGPALMVPLKQQFLFVDKIAVVDLNRMLARKDAYALAYPNSLADVVWLREEGFLYHIEPTLSVDLLKDPDAREALEDAGEATRKHEEVSSRIPEVVPEGGLREAIDNLNESMRQALISRSQVCRACAVSLRNDGSDAISLLPVPSPSSSDSAGRSNAIRVVVDSLPVPDESVAWEQIIEFRQDHDAVDRLLALRVWASDIGRSLQSSHEIREKLDYLLNEYSEQLRLHRMHTRAGSLEVVVSAAVDVAEHIGNMQIGSAAKAVLGLRHQNLELLLAERSFPGREVSYVIVAHQWFSEAKKDA